MDLLFEKRKQAPRMHKGIFSSTLRSASITSDLDPRSRAPLLQELKMQQSVERP